MPEKIDALNPADFDIPDSYLSITPQQVRAFSEDPLLKPSLRFFAQQVQDTLSGYFKVQESPQEKQFLRQCRKDSKAFRKALNTQLRSVAEKHEDEKSSSGFVFQRLRCSNKALGNEDLYQFSVEIRPLLFTSLLEDEEKAGKRYPYLENRYTVFLHLDQRHRFQMTRFAEPFAPLWYKFVMQEVLSVFSSKEIQSLFEQHYGDWKYIAGKIVEAMLDSLKLKK